MTSTGAAIAVGVPVGILADGQKDLAHRRRDAFEVNRPVQLARLLFSLGNRVGLCLDAHAVALKGIRSNRAPTAIVIL